jgi:hypothetical protein
MVAMEAGYTHVIDTMGYGNTRLEYWIEDLIADYRPADLPDNFRRSDGKVLFVDGGLASTKHGADLLYGMSYLAKEAGYDYIQDTRGIDDAVRKYYHYAVYFDPMFEELPF